MNRPPSFDQLSRAMNGLHRAQRAAQVRSPALHRRNPTGLPRVLGLIVIAVFVLSILRRGWMCDDAFITLRSVDNLVSGRGFVFNVGERVQGFTNPLWALLVAVPYSFSHELFATTVLSEVVVSTAFAVLLVFHVAQDRRIGAMVLTLLCFSRAFVDFSTSGLENPLSHLLLLLLGWAFFSEKQSMLRVSLCASLCLVNRLDSFILVAPIGVAAFFSRPSWSRLRSAVWGQLPVLAWSLFALGYYGFVFPNTAYAKLNTHIPRLEVLGQGVTYLLETVSDDPISAALLLFALAAGFGAEQDRGRVRVVLGSIVLGLAYIVSVGGDFMAGRFLTPVVALCALVLVRVAHEWFDNPEVLRWTGAGAAVLVVSVRFSPLRDEPEHERREMPAHGIVNERAWYMTGEQASLTMNIRNKQWQQSNLYRDGKAAQGGKERVVVAGNIGMYGVGAGPGIHVLDPLALTDPLLARVPFVYSKGWRPGHLGRVIPSGYIDSLKLNKNMIVEPCIHAYYDKLHTVVSGPLWSKARAKAIFQLNLPSGVTVKPCTQRG